MPHALVVDDDMDSATSMRDLVASEHFTVALAHNLRDARKQIALQQPDVLLLDLRLPDGTGMDLLADPELVANSEVVLCTGHADLETSIQALRLGAADYLVKPVSLEQLRGVLSRIMKPAVLEAEMAAFTTHLGSSGHFGHLWGRSAPMQRIYEQVSRVAGTSVTVFITGESGTGKEVVAQMVHDLSRRRGRPFLAVNCGAISPNLIESEIFGHEKGSFTGAERQHQGFFERASGGTPFLDEITEMPPELQVKLVRVLETRRYMRVGSTVAQEADVRVIAATNRLPQQALARAMSSTTAGCRWLPRADAAAAVAPESPRASAAAPMAMPDAGEPASGASASITLPIGTSMAQAERALMLATLRHCHHHKERTAAVLGISLKTLYNRLKEYAANSASNDDADEPSAWADDA